jgi:formylmethanofuran--tetrahydromethanopterin N-formyltransferase
MPAEIEDTYAEAFRSIYGEILITARDRRRVDDAVHACTGNASSTILCDCEAGIDRYVGPGTDDSFPTPDGRPGAIVQFHIPRFKKDREKSLERSMLVRISQNILTTPTAACFNLLDTDPYFKLGRKISFFGDGHQFRDERFGRKVWVIPILGGEFTLDRRFGFADGLMGGNIWFMGESVDAALLACEKAIEEVWKTPGCIAPFPGGLVNCGSKAGSRYSFSIASTYEKFCPTLREKLGDESAVPPGVQSILEIVINGRDLSSIERATQAAVHASVDTPGLIRISAGNYGGRLGKNFIYLRPRDDG